MTTSAPSPDRQLAAWGVGALPLAVATLRLGEPPLVAAWLAVGGALVVTAAPRRNWLVLASTLTVHAALLTAASKDPAILAYLSLSLLALAVTATGLVAPSFRSVARHEPASPSALLAIPLLAATAVLLGRPSYAATAIVSAPGTVMLLTASTAPRWWHRTQRRTAPLTRRFAHLHHRLHTAVTAVATLVGRVLAHVMLVVTWPFVAVVPWIATRAIRRDPLWAPHRSGSRWVTREATHDRQVASLWAIEPAPRTSTARHHLLPPAIALVALLVAGVAWRLDRLPPWRSGTAGGAVDDAGPGSEPSHEALRDLKASAWYPSWDAAWMELNSEADMTQYSGYLYHDLESPHLTYRDGVRRSWAPPADECDARVRVWAFGGSTMFGAGQRDGHTIPSELARAAWRDGVALDIDNRAVPADVAWVEQRRLERALATAEHPPDLVIFYDGFNDLRAAEWVYMAGRDPAGEFLTHFDATLMPLLNRFDEVEVGGNRELRAAPINPSVRPTDPEVTGSAAAWQYTAAIDDVAAQLAQRGVPFVPFFQPWVATRDPVVDGDFPRSDVQVASAARMRRGLTPGIVDIADVFDGTDEAYFTDDIHTNEAANVVIAARIWQEIAPLVTTPDLRGGTSCS